MTIGIGDKCLSPIKFSREEKSFRTHYMNIPAEVKKGLLGCE